MIKEALEWVKSQVEAAAEIEMEEINGRIYTHQSLTAIDPPITPNLNLHSLEGIIDIVNSSDFAARAKDLMIHVEYYNEVLLYDKVVESSKKRPVIARAAFDDTLFPFGNWLDLEYFIISMHSHMMIEKDFEKVAKFAMNISHDQSAGYHDDGISQTVRMRKGVVTTSGEQVPSPVELTPYRTFPEVRQPSSLFVFRIKSPNNPDPNNPPKCTLFEADGGAWKSDARRKIFHYFTDHSSLAGSGISIIA